MNTEREKATLLVLPIMCSLSPHVPCQPPPWLGMRTSHLFCRLLLPHGLTLRLCALYRQGDTAHSHPKSFNHQLKLQTRCHCFENQHSRSLYVRGGVTATPASLHLLHLHLWSLSFDFSHVIPFSTLMSFTNQPAKVTSSKPSKKHLLACSCREKGCGKDFKDSLNNTTRQ